MNFSDSCQISLISLEFVTVRRVLQDSSPTTILVFFIFSVQEPGLKREELLFSFRVIILPLRDGKIGDEYRNRTWVSGHLFEVKDS